MIIVKNQSYDNSGKIFFIITALDNKRKINSYLHFYGDIYTLIKKNIRQNFFFFYLALILKSFILIKIIIEYSAIQ